MPAVAPPAVPVATDRLLAFVDDARRAPSVLNSQPWRFVVAEGSVELYADRTRRLPGLDPEGREMTISCGTALAGLRLAARHDGLAARLALLPDPADPTFLARVTFEAARRPLDDRLLRALRARRTHRGDFLPDPVAPVDLAALDLAAGPDVWVRPLVTRDEKIPVAALVNESATAQGQLPEVVADLRAWLRRDDDPRRDGVRDGDQGSGDRLVSARTTAAAVGRHKASILSAAPAVLVVGTDGDDAPAWLRTGLGFGDLLVAAADRGLAVSYANEPVEMGGDYRRRLGALVGEAWPQIVVRIGRPAPPVDRRRPLRDVAEAG